MPHLREGDVHQSLRSRVHNVQCLHDGGAIVAHCHVALRRRLGVRGGTAGGCVSRCPTTMGRPVGALVAQPPRPPFG